MLKVEETSLLLNRHIIKIPHVKKMADSRKYPYLGTTDVFSDFRRGGGVHDYGILRAWGGIYVWKSEGMGGSIGGISGEESVQ